jgi:hypothetical protein
MYNSYIVKAFYTDIIPTLSKRSTQTDRKGEDKLTFDAAAATGGGRELEKRYGLDLCRS